MRQRRSRMKHPRVRKPRRGVLERPAPATFSSLPALASYPRNSRELSRLSFTSRGLFIVPPLAGNVHAQAWPHSRWKLVGETHSGKAPRSTPPTIGLLSRYFLPMRRTTPASSRRWSWGPYMAPRPGMKKLSSPSSSSRKELSYKPRWLLSLFALSLRFARPPSFLQGTAGFSLRLFAPRFCFRAIANNKRRYSPEL